MSTISLPTRQEFLEQLSSYPVEACSIIDADATPCTICIRDLVDTPANDLEERAVLLHDSHAFGEECARKWLASNNTCPKCRFVLFQEDNNADAAIDAAGRDARRFDEEELQHLLWQAALLSTRDPHTEAFSDHEVMAIYLGIFNQWTRALRENADGIWDVEGRRSNEVARALTQLLRVRYRWWQHSPEQLNLNITGRFIHPAGTWVPTERDLNRRVVIDFDADLESANWLMEIVRNLLAPAFDGVDCVNVAGHPVVVELIDRTDGLLQNLAGRSITVAALRQRLRAWVGDADRLESDGTHPLLPLGYADFVRWMVDQTTLKAIRRTKENRTVRRALRARARPVSRAPRMSAPSRRD